MGFGQRVAETSGRQSWSASELELYRLNYMIAHGKRWMEFRNRVTLSPSNAYGAAEEQCSMDAKEFDSLAKNVEKYTRGDFTKQIARVLAMTLMTLGPKTVAASPRRRKESKQPRIIFLEGVAPRRARGKEHRANAASPISVPLAAPWYSGPNAQVPTWQVIDGYNSGPCHFANSGCGERTHDEYYAFDLKPQDVDAGGRYVMSPVKGKLKEPPFFEDGKGWYLKIFVHDAAGQPTPKQVVHLYHLENLQVGCPGGQCDTVDQGQRLGDVYSHYRGAPNHLHIQVNDYSGNSMPLRIAGRSYIDRGGSNQWINTLIRSNALYSGPNMSGDAATFLTNGSISALSRTNGGVGNDNTSSVRVNAGCTMTLWEHTNYRGRKRVFVNGGAIKLTGFDNMTSSVSLYCS